MEIIEQTTDGVVVLTLAGRLDALTADGVRERLLAGVGSAAPRLVLDFARLTYVSSAGLRVLLELSRRVTAAEGRLALCALVRQVQQVFDLAGFAALIPIHATREEALAALA
jgi:anti-anti-sigma factor